MAKSFKQLTSTPAAKRTSEKDILDFLEQDHLSAAAAVPARQTAPADPEPAPVSSGRRKTPSMPVAESTPAAGNSEPLPAGAQSAVEATLIGKRAVKDQLPADNQHTGTAPGTRRKRRVTDVTNVTEVGESQGSEADIRQTFVLGQHYLEKLKNFVHTRRMQGQYDFTQKQALHQALDLLFATGRIEERPAQIREKEEARRQQIRKGKAR